MRKISTKSTTIKPSIIKSKSEKPAPKKVSKKENFYQKVQEVAYQLYVDRGCAHGHDAEDWAKAEEIVKGS